MTSSRIPICNMHQGSLYPTRILSTTIYIVFYSLVLVVIHKNMLLPNIIYFDSSFYYYKIIILFIWGLFRNWIIYWISLSNLYDLWSHKFIWLTTFWDPYWEWSSVCNNMNSTMFINQLPFINKFSLNSTLTPWMAHYT